MRSLRMALPIVGCALLTTLLSAQQQEEKKPGSPPVMQSGGRAAKAPEVWIDAKTGHRVFRLTPEAGGSARYFHDNIYTADGDKVVFTAKGQGEVVVDLKELEKGVVKREVLSNGSFLGMRYSTREAYFTGGGLTAIDVDTKAQRQVKGATGKGLVNCDETTTFTTTKGQDQISKIGPRPQIPPLPQRERMFGDKIKAGIPLTPEEEASAKKEQGLAGRAVPTIPEAFIFRDLLTGKTATTPYQWGSLNHMQWSPSDPDYLLYCHEGTWHELDRVWIVKRDGTDQRLVHKRTMDMEIAGHEWWSRDGKIVWYDNQTPRSHDFWIKGYEIYTKDRWAYHMERNEWGIHFTSAKDNKTFSSDGAGKGQVSFAPEARWIYVLRASLDPVMTQKKNEIIEGKQVQYGTFKSEKLVDMTYHGYSLEPGNLEPNAHISPDGKWVIFTTNMFGDPSSRHVLAVEVAPWKQ